VVLAVDPDGWFPFGPVKWLLVSVGVWLLSTITFAGRRTVVVEPRVQLALFALFVVFAFAAMRGADPTYAWTGTPERHFGAVTWLLLALGFFVGVNLAAPLVVLTGALVAGFGLGACATFEALGWEPRVFAVDDRLSATLGSPAYLGAFSAVLLPVAVGCACDRSLTRPMRLLATVAAPLLVVALLGSGARAAWFGVAASLTVLAIRRGREVVNRAATRRLVMALSAFVVVAVAIALWSPVGDRAASLFDDDAPGGAGRVDEWRVAANVAREHLPLGVGPEGYRIAFAEGVDAAYERDHGRDPTPDRAHSAPLDVLLAGGVGAVALWLASLTLVGRYVWRALCDERLWVVGVGAAVIAHAAGLLVLFPLAELEPIVWLLAGVVVAATGRAGETRVVPVPRFSAVVPAVAAAAALVAGVTDVVADRSAYDATVALARGDTERAYQKASDAAALRPDVIRLHLLEAETARRADRSTVEALGAIDDALAVSPHDPVVTVRHLTLLVDRAAATLVPEHALVASGAVAVAVERDPHHARLRLLEGEAARLRGDDAAAEQAWLLAETLGPRASAAPRALAALYADQHRLADARAALERAALLAPDDAQVAALRRRLDGLD
jgi:hypothetical protein